MYCLSHPHCFSILFSPPMFTYIKSLTQHLPSLPSPFMSVSFSFSLSGCTWYSLACLSSRRLDGSNLLEQAHVLARIIHSTKPELAALKSSSILLSSIHFFFSPLQFVPGYILSPFARLTGRGVQRRLRQPPPPQSAGWVFSFFSPSLHLILPLLPASYSSSSSSCG